MTLCLLWWSFCSSLEKNVLCSASIIVIHDFHIFSHEMPADVPDVKTKGTWFCENRASQCFDGTMASNVRCHGAMLVYPACPEETKGFLSERVAGKTAYCRTPKGLPEGGRFSVEKRV